MKRATDTNRVNPDPNPEDPIFWLGQQWLQGNNTLVFLGRMHCLPKLNICEAMKSYLSLATAGHDCEEI